MATGKFEVYSDKSGQSRFRLKNCYQRDYCSGRGLQFQGILHEWYREREKDAPTASVGEVRN